MAKIQPPLTKDAAAEIEADFSITLAGLDRLRAELTAVSGPADALRNSPMPAHRADGYFDIAAFVERMRDHARRVGVQVNQDERFGFADYAHTGPEPEDLPMIFRERCVTEFLLRTLFETHPHQLLAVQRERRPGSGLASVGRDLGRGASASADYFDWDPRASVRLPNIVEVFALRVSFIGQTVSLRILLNDLAAFELPLVVRAVEVEPAPATADERRPTAGESEIVAPLVPRSLSHFTVTVELIELVNLSRADS
jgi:hypothetical protein